MINEFRGKYYFLSNFYEAPVTWNGLTYLNNEAAFQSAKTFSDRECFTNLDPSSAKKLGRKVQLRNDWENVKDNVMYEICKAKFSQNAELKNKLLATGDEHLEEGNTWGDKIWGTVNGIGENRLGKILMKIREELKMSNFNAVEVKDKCVEWIRDFFDKNGNGCNAIVGISGGKDSSVVAALCVEALGKDRVIGVLMPNGEQNDIDIARKLVDFLDIMNFEVNIKEAVNGVLNSLPMNGYDISEQTITNLPARIRMTTLYALSQSMNGRVANTCNLSEDWVGYATRYGDAAGDFSPLSQLTVTEVKEIGRVLGLPTDLVDKTPSDGLCGKTDEDNLGFTYEVLDRYIRTGEIDDKDIKNKIDAMHEKNLFKLQLMPSFKM